MVGICPQIPFVLQPVDIGTNLLRSQLFQQAIGGERVQPKLQDTANFAAAEDLDDEELAHIISQAPLQLPQQPQFSGCFCPK